MLTWTVFPSFSGSSYVYECNNIDIVGGYDRFGLNAYISKTLSKPI